MPDVDQAWNGKQITCQVGAMEARPRSTRIHLRETVPGPAARHRRAKVELKLAVRRADVAQTLWNEIARKESIQRRWHCRPHVGVVPQGQASVRSPTRWGCSGRRGCDFRETKSLVCLRYYPFRTKMGGSDAGIPTHVQRRNIGLFRCYVLLPSRHLDSGCDQEGC